jgi:hypothetical protein
MGDYQPSIYETVAASQSDQVFGPGAGAAGAFLHSLIVTVGTSATGTVEIDDGGGTNIPIVPANTPIGVYVVVLNLRSRAGGWRITTGAGATVIATGDAT